MEPAPSIRRATTDDLAAVIALATVSLGWDPAEPNEAFFRWKHLDNPAGASPMWLALDGDEPVGFRSMLRWRCHDGEREHRAVRAVDTATHPDHLRRGIFRALTTTAVDELTGEGVDFVFNTPNARSRPGYLSMGWVDGGRLPVRLAVSGPASMVRVLGARAAARKWSEPLSAGDPVAAVARDLASRAPTVDGISTLRDEEHLRWRYGFEPLHYRVLQCDGGAAIVRLRRRGSATEAVVADVVSDSVRATRTILRAVRRLPGVDHVLTLARAPHPASWAPTVPGLGPHLTLRDLGSTAPPASSLRFGLGDIELF